MIPLKDDLPTSRRPYLTILLILINVLVFLAGQRAIESEAGVTVRQNDVWAFEWGLYPCEITGRCDVTSVEVPAHQIAPFTAPETGGMVEIEVESHDPWLTLLTSAFLHGGWLHLVGNMLFLWIFGNNVEDSMNPFEYLAFYFGAALFSAFAQVWANTASTIPQIGASGAIAAVIGGYLLLYPKATVLTVFMVGFIFVRHVRAWIVAGLWGVLQVIGTTGQYFSPEPGGGIAYAAHLGGFVFGLALVRLLGAPVDAYRQMYGDPWEGSGADGPFFR